MASNPYLPEDIIREVLSRLPMKSLLQFMVVCKDWLALLKSSDFIDSHYQHQPKQCIMLTSTFPVYKNYVMSLLRDGKRSSRPDVRNISISSIINSGSPYYPCIIGSANGLVCVYVIPDSIGSIASYILWNPATRAYRRLPSTRYHSFGKSPCASGFGFHPGTKDYKLLIVHHASSKSLKAEVFTLSTGSWKKVKQTNPVGGCSLSRGSSVTVKGMWYHVAFPKKIQDQSSLSNQTVLSILKFDMGSDTFLSMEVGLPYDDIGEDNISLMVYKETLAMSVYWDKTSTWNLELDVWTMENECWTKLFICRVPIPERISPSEYPWSDENIELWPLGIWNDKEIILQEYSGRFNHYHLNLLDPLTEKSNMVLRYQHCQFHEAHTYVESLVSVFGTETKKKSSDGKKKRRRAEGWIDSMHKRGSNLRPLGER